MAKDQIGLRILTPSTQPHPTPPFPFFSPSLGIKFNKICELELYIKRLLLAALNSSLNVFFLQEKKSFLKNKKKNLEEERGIIVLILLPAVILRHFLEGEMASCLPNPNPNPSGPGSCWRKAACSPHPSTSAANTQRGSGEIKLTPGMNLNVPVHESLRRSGAGLRLLFAYHLIKGCVMETFLFGGPPTQKKQKTNVGFGKTAKVVLY